jgi:hypothetical protein
MKISAVINLIDQGSVALIENVFPASLVKEILEFFNNSANWESTQTFEHYQGRMTTSGDPALTEKILAHANSPAVLSLVNSYLGAVQYSDNVEYWKDLPGYLITPHLDFVGEDPYCHAQIYFGDQIVPLAGTLFHNRDQQPLFNLTYRNNYGYLLNRGDTACHGLWPVPAEVERFSIHLKYRNRKL